MNPECQAPRLSSEERVAQEIAPRLRAALQAIDAGETKSARVLVLRALGWCE